MAPFTQRVIFFPFTRRQVEEGDAADATAARAEGRTPPRMSHYDAEAKAERWTAKHGHRSLLRLLLCQPKELYVPIVYLSDESWQAELARLGTSDTDQLYIVGHNEREVGTLSASGANYTVQIDADGLMDLLDPVLMEGFGGTIKIFACESALGATNGGSESLAQRFAELAHRKWPRCTIVGYNRTIVLGARHQKAGQVPFGPRRPRLRAALDI